jgi:thioredoxin reductase (NADPH)
MIYPVAIIGGGSAGVMAVLRTVLNNTPCVFFPGTPLDKKRSRALWVRKIENMPAHFGYSRGIEEPNAETLQWVSESDFAQCLTWLKNTGVTSLARNPDGIFRITDSKGVTHEAHHVILCTGVMDVQPLINGSIEPIFPFANNQLVDYCLRCDGHHVAGKSSAVIGHTTSAAWVAIMLYERYRPPSMHLLSHGEEFAYDDETRELMDMYGIQRHASAISVLLGDAKAGAFEGFTLENGSRISLGIAFVSLGMLVYSDLAKILGAELDARGFVKADANGLTSVPGFYVAGDVMAGTKKQIYTAWDTAVNAADAVNQKIRALKRQEDLKTFRAR